MNRLLLVTNLFPRPDQPRRGVFNAHFTSALAGALGGPAEAVLDVLVPVPDWHIGRHGSIRSWRSPPELTALLPSGVGVHYQPTAYVPVVGRSLSAALYARAFRARLDLFQRCDAVLGSWVYPDAVAAATVAQEAGKPCWVRLHGTDRFHFDARIRGSMCHRACDAAEGVFVNAARMREELSERGVSENKITVARNGVDRGLFHPRALVGGDPLASNTQGERVVLWVGNLSGIKGPDDAVRAFAQIDERQTPKVQLVVIGEGRMQGQLEGLTRELGLLERVTFLGSCPHEDVAQWMSRADCLLLSSHSEGMPNVILEALASGTPVVATDVGDVSSVIRDGLNGRVVQANADETPSLLADALTDALSRTWDVGALRDSVSEYDWQRSAQIVVDAIRGGA